MRRGVCLLVLGVLAAALAAASARADGTTTSAATTTTTSTPTYARLTPTYLPAECVGAGAAAIAEPGRRVLAFGTPAASRGASGYPATTPLVAFGSSTGSSATCTSGQVTLQSVSLFNGLVTASSVSATGGHGTVSGLVIDGSPVAAAPGQSYPVGYWGQLTVGKTVDRLTAPLVLELIDAHGSLPAGTTIVVAFAATAAPVAHKPSTTHNAKPKQHPATSTKPSGTTPSSGSPKARSQPGHAKKKHRHKKVEMPQPLTARPSLGYRPKHYVFPVDGGASYVDTYGGNRNDIYDGWHHGDDLFSPLGTPVVAVANGSLSLVGWNRLGGWRLWLTDNKGNSFYYAHLAGYSRWILDHPNVRAGQVVGFLGRTGDAFTTDPHLHFEVHPHQYLERGYDGAVDPTTYLQKWKVVHVPAKEIPRPAKLKAPVGTPSQEAAVVWHELLVARHLLHAKGSAASGSAVASSSRPIRLPAPEMRALEASGVTLPPLAGVQRTAAHVAAPASMTPWLGGGISGAVLVVGLSAGGFFMLRRRRRTENETPDETASEPAA